MIVSAFADEIASDVAVQLAVLERHGVSHVDLRTVNGRSVIELGDAQLSRSATGFVGTGSLWQRSPHRSARSQPTATRPPRRRLTRAAAIARLLDTDLIRVFGFYPPKMAPTGRKRRCARCGRLPSAPARTASRCCSRTRFGLVPTRPSTPASFWRRSPTSQCARHSTPRTPCAAATRPIRTATRA